MPEIKQTSILCQFSTFKETFWRLKQDCYRHRAATTGSTGFVTLLLHPPEGSPKTRLNTGDRIGNTPLHLAMESAHGETAALLIEAGADRSRLNLDEQTAEQLDGVGGVEQRRARAYVIDRCGPQP